MNVVVAILAGGHSQRMGEDKADIILGGMTLLERTIRNVHLSGLPAMVIGRAPGSPGIPPGVICAEDEQPGLGPIGGLATALNRTMNSVLGVGCDMPLLTADALRWLAEVAGERQLWHGLAILNGSELEPLFSVYAPASRSLISEHIAKGDLSLHSVIEAGQFDRLEAPPWIGESLRNVNTPEDLAVVENLVSGRGRA